MNRRMNRHDIWQRITCRHMAEVAILALWCLLELKGSWFPAPSIEPEKLVFSVCLFSQIIICFLGCVDYVHCVNWNCFHQSFVALESVRKCCRFEWAIFCFTHYSCMNCMPWCVLLDEQCVSPALLSSYIEKGQETLLQVPHEAGT